MAKSEGNGQALKPTQLKNLVHRVVTDAFEHPAHGLEYSGAAIAAATKICRLNHGDWGGTEENSVTLYNKVLEGRPIARHFSVLSRV